MSHGLIQQDWNDRINQCLERIVTGSWVEYQYIANPSDARLDYHKRVVRECYLRHAEAGSFDIECVMEDIIDHDETQLEMASDSYPISMATCWTPTISRTKICCGS